MSELESSDNFCSFVNGDGDNDVTEVYENDDDDEMVKLNYRGQSLSCAH